MSGVAQIGGSACPMAMRCPAGLPVCPTCKAAALPSPGALAKRGINEALDVANIICRLDEEADALRAKLAAANSEIAGLKRHIEAMGRAE